MIALPRREPIQYALNVITHVSIDDYIQQVLFAEDLEYKCISVSFGYSSQTVIVIYIHIKLLLQMQWTILQTNGSNIYCIMH